MSVGGRVLCVNKKESYLQAVTWDTASPSQKCLAVDISKTPAALAIEPGDTIWWQGSYVLWTPQDAAPDHKASHDIKIPKISYSYSCDEYGNEPKSQSAPPA